VTHHGVNVRTYVEGAGGDKAGIHFSSLECDDRFAAFGANIFGMPYKVANITRRYILGKSITKEDLPNFSSASHCDDFACGKSQQYRVKRFSLSSVRSSKASSLFNLLIQSLVYLYDTSLALHGTDVRLIGQTSDDGKVQEKKNESTRTKTTTVKQSSFCVECEWERCAPEEQVEDSAMTHFFVERYYVYTRKYGLNWRGQVEHQPWPVEPAKLINLTITNVASYQPVVMQPLIQHMASTPPDSVLFSPGVGPVEFNMLRPV
jgi:uncharacterized protein YqjF (DUF2071 family)